MKTIDSSTNDSLKKSHVTKVNDLQKIASMRSCSNKFTFPTNENHRNMPEDIFQSRNTPNTTQKYDQTKSLGPSQFSKLKNCESKIKVSEKAVRVDHNVFNGSEQGSPARKLGDPRYLPRKSVNQNHSDYKVPNHLNNMLNPNNQLAEFGSKKMIELEKNSSTYSRKSSFRKINLPGLKNGQNEMSNDSEMIKSTNSFDNKKSQFANLNKPRYAIKKNSSFYEKSPLLNNKKKAEGLNVKIEQKLDQKQIQSHSSLSDTDPLEVNTPKANQLYARKEPKIESKSMRSIILCHKSDNAIQDNKTAALLSYKKKDTDQSKRKVVSKNNIRRRQPTNFSNQTRLIVSHNTSKFHDKIDLFNDLNTSDVFEDELDTANIEEIQKANPIFCSLAANTKGGFADDSEKDNQDRYLIKIGIDGDKKCESNRILLGVFDGHGTHGGKISQHINDNFVDILEDHACIQATMNDRIKFNYENEREVIKLFTDTYMRVNNSTNERYVKEGNLSGSTGVTCFISGNKFYCANIGDSECGLLIGTELFGQYTIKMQSTNHQPSNPIEKDRIEMAGGKIEKYQSKKTGNFYGPLRVWTQTGGGPGLMMTRTFGDRLGHSIGMSDIPDVCVEPLKPCYKALILGSDGIWEIQTKKQIAEIVGRHSVNCDARAAVKDLVATASYLWTIKNEDDLYRDDITVIVGYFHE